MDQVTVLLQGDLGELGPRRTTVSVPHRRSVKDAIESLGVPHTELGWLAVDDQPVGGDHVLEGGETVVAWSVTATPDVPACDLRPPPPRRPPAFVADVHLGTLARRLRLLGFDTWWRNDADDALLADVATSQQRVLLTRDRGLLMRRRVVHGALVRHDDPPAQLDQVLDRYDLGAALAPRTRCVRCNGLLETVTLDEVADRLEPGTLAAGHDRHARCRDCERIYWPGAHDPDLDRIVARARVRGQGPTTDRRQDPS